MTTTQITFAIANNEAQHKTEKQYGMAYPDGTIRWGHDEDRGQHIHFADLARGNGDALTQWGRRLRTRAIDAHVSVDEYRAQHELVERDVTVFTSDPRPTNPK